MFPPLRSLDTFAGNLPSQTTSFVGREQEQERLTAALGEARLVTVTGTGGVGKTRLALQVAAELLPEFPDGAWLCELAVASDRDSMLQAVATTLRVTPGVDRTLEESILDNLRSRSVLVVLDNCEHLLDAVSDLAGAIVRGSPNRTNPGHQPRSARRARRARDPSPLASASRRPPTSTSSRTTAPRSCSSSAHAPPIRASRSPVTTTPGRSRRSAVASTASRSPSSSPPPAWSR